MFYFDEDHMENGFDEPACGGVDIGGLDKCNQEFASAVAGVEKSGINVDASTQRSEAAMAAALKTAQVVVTQPHGQGHHHIPSRHHHHHRAHPTRNFGDHYRMVNDELGSGAYACVRTAISVASGDEFAVKLVDKHEPGHTHSRIRREVEIFRMCKDHPNIVQLVDCFEDEDFYYMVFEKMHGGPLLNRIQRKGCFTEQEASLVTRDIASALKYLHDRGIAHRDVKPENILCTNKDHVSPVKLCDLDLASKPMTTKAPRGLHVVQSEPNLASPVGSAEFMAPEVVDAFVGDSLKYDKRCDMWSLGVIIYIMLCGYPPFYGECDRDNCGWDQGKSCHDCQDNLFHRIQRGEYDFPDEEWADVSTEVKDLICHLLVRNVRLRYTADDVLRHPWVVNGAPDTQLQTPSNLSRNDSTRDVHQMNEHFNTINRRLTAVHISSRLETVIQESTQESSSGIGTSAEVSPVGTPAEDKSISVPSIDEISAKLQSTALDEVSGASDVEPVYPSYQYGAPAFYSGYENSAQVQLQPVVADHYGHYDLGGYGAVCTQPGGHYIDNQSGMLFCAPPQTCSYGPMMMGPHHHPVTHTHSMPLGSDYYASAGNHVHSGTGQHSQMIQTGAHPPHHQPQLDAAGMMGNGPVYFAPPPSPFYYYVIPPPTDMVNG